MKITREGLKEAVRAYEDCVPMAEIATWFGVTRQGLWKAFKREGIETRKRYATRRKVICDQCGVEYEMTRARYREKVRDNGNVKKFCSDTCYYVYLENKDSISNRHHQRIARYKVSQVFDLKDEHVVHHKDGNHFNTRLDNFMVFANQSDHIRYHHQLRQGEITVKPIWDGGRHDIVIGDNGETVGDALSKINIREKYKMNHPNEMCPRCRNKNRDCEC